MKQLTALNVTFVIKIKTRRTEMNKLIAKNKCYQSKSQSEHVVGPEMALNNRISRSPSQKRGRNCQAEITVNGPAYT